MPSTHCLFTLPLYGQSSYEIVLTPLLDTDKHFDHTGRPSAFKKAKIWTHADERDAIPALKDVSESSIHTFRWSVSEHPPIASFDHSLDVFGDGSLLVVALPGHTPGHIGALVRDTTGSHVLLGADVCHHRRLMNGARDDERKFSLAADMYEDIDEATRSLERIRRAKQCEDILVVTAHDEKQWDAFVERQSEPVVELTGWKEKGLKAL